MQYDYSKLRGRIVEKFHSVSKFADTIGVAVPTVVSKLNGKRDITKSDILLWSDVLEIDVSEIGIYFFTLKV